MNDDAADVPPAWRLGSDVALRLEDFAALHLHTLCLLRQASRQVWLQTADLEPALYDQADVEAALRRLLLASPRHQVRLLVGDTAPARRRGHRLLGLARRLTSNLEIHRPPADTLPLTDRLIIDDLALLRRTPERPSEGYVRYGDRAAVKLQRQAFERLWERSRPDPELRSLPL